MLPFIKVGNLTVSTYILTWATLFVIATFMLRRILGTINVPKFYAEILMVITAIFGVAGGKLYGMIKYIAVHPDSDLEVTFRNSGFGFYGLMLFGFGAAIIAMKNAKLPILTVLDQSAPILILGVVMGRLACFLTGDSCYGPPTNLPWGMAFPHGVHPTFAKVHPTPLYEIAAMLLVALIINRFPHGKYPQGSKLILFLFLASAVRFSTEFYRLTNYEIAGISAEQIIAVIIIVCSGVLSLYSFQNNRQFFNKKR